MIESWLDVTGTLHLFGGDPVALANQLRDVMKQELGLTISVGVSFNKVFAKLGSDYKKPDATTVIWREDVPRIVWPLPVTDLLFCGQGLCPGAGEGGHPHHWRLGRGPPGPGGAAVGKNMGGRSTTTPPGRTTAQSARRERCRPPKSVGNGLTFRRNLVGGGGTAGRGLSPGGSGWPLQAAAAPDEVHHRAGGPAPPEFKTIQRQKATPAPHQRLPGHCPVRTGVDGGRLALCVPPCGL